jgi:hypothetical protein
MISLYVSATPGGKARQQPIIFTSIANSALMDSASLCQRFGL